MSDRPLRLPPTPSEWAGANAHIASLEAALLAERAKAKELANEILNRPVGQTPTERLEWYLRIDALARSIAPDCVPPNDTMHGRFK